MALVVVDRLVAQVAGAVVVGTAWIDTLFAGGAEPDGQGVEEIDGGDEALHAADFRSDRLRRLLVLVVKLIEAGHLVEGALEAS
ncbi:hypothetical protein [Streptomyces sp. 2A115]|uniref:hypothetical protein n=1 Tax=Streptomyces sp. 2A115 TaxID=3457439 RepID=UPI003FCEEDF2